MSAPIQTAQCPRCGKTCDVRSHNHAHCSVCFSGFRVDRPEACPTDHERQRLFEPAPEQLPGQTGLDI